MTGSFARQYLETVNMFFNDAVKAGLALPGVEVR